MSAEESTTNNLLATLHMQATEMLNNIGVYSVLDYAWEGEDTPSDEYLGLAIWSSDAPFKPRWNIWDQTSLPPMPTERDEIFYKAGEDFIGTMELAKNAIGLVLYSFEHRKPDNIMDDAEYFWEYRAAASVWLNIAADRLRDYFVMARFGITAKEYGTLDDKNGKYARPFRMHQPTDTPRAKTAAVALLKDAEKLRKHRYIRNEIVHAIASKQGENAVISLKQQKEEASQKPYVSRSSSEAVRNRKTWTEAIEAMSAKRKKELEDAISILKNWYILLIHAAGLVFEYEYWKRIKR